VLLAIIVAFLAIMAYAGAHLASTLVRRVTSPAAVARAVSMMLDRTAAAAQGLTPEREQQMREDLRIIVGTLQPFAAELRPLFADQPPASPEDSRKR
jgi:hypothetical protein